MTNTELAAFYERDLRQLIEEINLFQQEENLWKTIGSIKNTAGNLALHIIGGTKFLIGTTLAHTGYVRHRDEEFTTKGVERSIIITELEALIPVVCETITALTPQQMQSPYPRFFDKEGATISYVLTQLLLHLNYHLGEVNYLRRALE